MINNAPHVRSVYFISVIAVSGAAIGFSMDYFNYILKHPHMYRPRFFWLETGD